MEGIRGEAKCSYLVVFCKMIINFKVMAEMCSVFICKTAKGEMVSLHV